MTPEQRKAKLVQAMEELHKNHKESIEIDKTSGIDTMLSSDKKAFRDWILLYMLYHLEKQQSAWIIAMKIVERVNMVLRKVEKDKGIHPVAEGYQWFYANGLYKKNGVLIGYRGPTAASYWSKTAKDVAGIEYKICDDIAAAMKETHPKA